jgi:hypothetical protein
MFFGNQDILDTYNRALTGGNSNYRVISGKYLNDNGVDWEFLKTIVKPICPSDSIDSNYLNDKVKEVINQTTSDMAVIVDNRQFVMGNNVTLGASVKGFLITQTGECNKFPEVHSLSLICGNVQGIGSIMMGAYLYMIKANNFNITDDDIQIGILDLASSFFNVKGYCAYTKFGFQYNQEMELYSDCYDPADGFYNNLPMFVNVKSWSQEYIVSIVNLEERLPKDPLCDLRGDEQIIESVIKKITTAKDAIQQNNPQHNELQILKTLTDNVEKFESDKFKQAYRIIMSRFNPDTLKREKIKNIHELNESFEKLRRNEQEDMRKNVLYYISTESKEADRDKRREDKSVKKEAANDAEPAQRRFLTARSSARPSYKLGGKRKSTRKSKRRTLKNKRKTRRKLRR